VAPGDYLGTPFPTTVEVKEETEVNLDVYCRVLQVTMNSAEE
jgi:hypothetical protein